MRGAIQKTGDSSERVPPSIFTAAETDDVAELQSALRDGQSLNDTSGYSGSTPMHVACINNSVNFVRYAVSTGEVDPWIRDDNRRLAIDHAASRGQQEIQRLLISLMYPKGWEKSGVVEGFPENEK